MSEMLVHLQDGGRIYTRGKTPVVALAAATCSVMPGDRIALVGPSGSGKSTLLHLLAGLEMLTSGTLTWPALGARKALRPTKVGLVFQMPSLLAPLTVVENVEIPLLLGQASAEKARVAGSAIVGNNLAARLDAVRKDALYALVLFLFLGIPGAVSLYCSRWL